MPKSIIVMLQHSVEHIAKARVTVEINCIAVETPIEKLHLQSTYRAI